MTGIEVALIAGVALSAAATVSSGIASANAANFQATVLEQQAQREQREASKARVARELRSRRAGWPSSGWSLARVSACRRARVCVP